MTSSLAAILTAYRPDAGFGDRFRELAQSCRALIVVDNTPGGHRFGELPANTTVLQDGVNKGLGRALNLGIARATELGCDAVVLFDQDSSPPSSLIDALQAALSRAGSRAVVAPVHIDDQTGRDTAVLSSFTTPTAPLKQVSCLATSGMLFRLGETPLEAFSEELFLDLVDFEWCWRMGRAGWSFYRVTNVPMAHRLGEGQRRFAGLTYHLPAPYRHYFQFRDTLRVVPRSYVPLYPKLRLLCILPLKLIAYPWLMDRGLERLGWMLRGVRDALLGRLGVGAAGPKLNA